MIRYLIPGVLVVGAIVFLLSAYTVGEGEQVVITQFGEPIGEPIREPGLHLRTPIVQDVRRFEKRVLQWDGTPEQIVTMDKKYIFIDTMARWRIHEPLLFLQAVRDEDNATTRLDDIIDGAVRDAISSKRLIDAVRTSNREMLLDTTQGTDVGERAELENVELGRERLALEITHKAAVGARPLGIELLDVRIKSINYVPRVLQQVYERMISERERIAALYRAEGEKEGDKILGELERDLLGIESDAFRQVEEIRGAADAEAASIYAEAYEQDADFYSFVKTLETYETALAKGDLTFVASTDSELFRLLGWNEAAAED